MSTQNQNAVVSYLEHLDLAVVNTASAAQKAEMLIKHPHVGAVAFEHSVAFQMLSTEDQENVRAAAPGDRTQKLVEFITGNAHLDQVFTDMIGGPAARLQSNVPYWEYSDIDNSMPAALLPAEKREMIASEPNDMKKRLLLKQILTDMAAEK